MPPCHRAAAAVRADAGAKRRLSKCQRLSLFVLLSGVLLLSRSASRSWSWGLGGSEVEIFVCGCVPWDLSWLPCSWTGLSLVHALEINPRELVNSMCQFG